MAIRAGVQSMIRGSCLCGQVRFELDLIRQRSTIRAFKGIAKVDGAVVCEAELMAMIVDK